MAQHVWTIPCRFSTTSSETNNVSLIEVLEEISIPALPVQQMGRGMFPAMFDVVTLWSRENDDQEEAGFGKMSFVGANGEVLLENPYPIDLLRQNKRFRG